MSAYNRRFSREDAVLASAELLFKAQTAFFPVDIPRLAASFSPQISLVPYKALREMLRDGTEGPAFDPLALSRDGFCIRHHGILPYSGEGNVKTYFWRIFYNGALPENRIRFTLAHELGHVFLGHFETQDTDTLPEQDKGYDAADAQADVFAACLLCPAPSAVRLLREHGFSCSKETGFLWKLTDPGAPFLRHLGKTPDPVRLVMTSYGLSEAAACRRLRELTDEMGIWNNISRDLFSHAEGIPHRAGWHCGVCGTRRRTSSLYCTGCGKGLDYRYTDPGRLPRPVIGLKKNGRFAFCAVCGSSENPDDAAFCAVCASPLANECENTFMTDGDFIRTGMPVVRGVHFCRPTDIFCGACGAVTAFGERHGPKENLWLSSKKSGRCRTASAVYPPVIPEKDRMPLQCPSCGSRKTVRDGRYCADCLQPLGNSCAKAHPCGPNSRYCPLCGSPTLFYRAGFLPDYINEQAFADLRERERKAAKTPVPRLIIQSDGSVAAR